MVPSESAALKEGVSSDEEEHYVDAHGSDSEHDVPGPSNAKKPRSAWVHRQNVATRQRSAYDPWNRNPLFAGAEHTVAHELTLLAKHYHPSVALFATQILQGTPIDYSGDPLEDYTSKKFLDRFVYRNPRTKGEKEEMKLMFGKRRTYDPWSAKALSVTSSEYAAKREHQIPEQERFLHRYMSSVSKPAPKETESDIESVGSDEFDAIVDSMDPVAPKDEYVIDKSKPHKDDQFVIEDSSDDDIDEASEEDSEEDSEMETALMDVSRREVDAESDDDLPRQKDTSVKVKRRKRGAVKGGKGRKKRSR